MNFVRNNGLIKGYAVCYNTNEFGNRLWAEATLNKKLWNARYKGVTLYNNLIVVRT